MISTQQISIWTRILLGGAALFGVFLAIGYGLIGIFIALLLLAMGGGALLYWLDGD